MDKKVLIPIFVLIIFVLGLFLASFIDTPSISTDSGENLHFNVSSEGPMSLSELISSIKTHEYYEGYNISTVEWMESLGSKEVFSSTDGFVIMSSYDASKIPSIYANDVSFYEIFDADVIENHSLGNTKYPKNIFYVKNVNYLREEAVYYPV